MLRLALVAAVCVVPVTANAQTQVGAASVLRTDNDYISMKAVEFDSCGALLDMPSFSLSCHFEFGHDGVRMVPLKEARFQLFDTQCLDEAISSSDDVVRVKFRFDGYVGMSADFISADRLSESDALGEANPENSLYVDDIQTIETIKQWLSVTHYTEISIQGDGRDPITYVFNTYGFDRALDVARQCK
ncbi:hypothetical protein [Ruegeria sp. EL01]|jgi:hypothetical protein|uniref:hypothetical protein n=1 Tax=Ruegeria sp. EL01 TaxID=2107578 RepID=UPI000EA8118C|nr:hypothetical protein [Ruegeria sp. EL01]